MSTPYTYLVGWSKHNLWYYGSRFGKDCDPTDLWVKYFTSSKKVKELRKTIGEPDIIQIRQIFNDHQKALNWELKVLRRMKVVYSHIWLNQSYVTAAGVMRIKTKGPMSEDQKQKISKAHKGRPSVNKGIPKSEETKQKMSIARRKRAVEPPAWNKGIPMSEEAKKHLSEINKGKPAWNKGIPNDVARGVPRTEEVRSRISKSLKGRPRTEKQMEGTPHSDTTKDHLSQLAKSRRWYNNGIITKGFQTGSIIPEGFVPGRLNFNPHKTKSA